ncbi:MAG: DUF2293 domain-containing protein [Planctomycetaceae bacterium]|nr:DUF2293 domain-containing protein [Planctomycetaceae bacterium]
MPDQTRTVSPGSTERKVRTADGVELQVPVGWVLLPPGDAGWTRRVKAGGPTWTVKEKKGRRTFSKGVWAPRERVEETKRILDAERSTDAYAKRKQRDQERREEKQAVYVEDFYGAVLKFLDFDRRFEAEAQKMAKVVTDHATPVGSGTVARTERIPIERRAESAVIAWLRHQTTAYDHMKIPRVKGKRREVRRMLAEESRRLLSRYRTGDVVDAAACPLQRALQ